MNSTGQQATAAGPPPGPAGGPGSAITVARSRRSAVPAGISVVVIVGALAYLPYLVYSGTTNLLTNFFMLAIMASMWNLLAGYAGLVSVGQQAFVGLGAYGVLLLASHGTSPFVAIPVATVGCAVIGLPVWWLVSRLRSGYFAITMWVIASVCELIISQIPSFGGGTGTGLPGLPADPTLLTADTYWVTIACAVIALGGIYLLLRSPIGLVLTAVRDEETGARSIGAKVASTQRLVFLVAAAGCGVAGAIYIVSQQFVEPTAAFSVLWSAKMIFITIIGGIGTIEGPIFGTIIYFALQQTLAQYGTWYFIALGLVAMFIAIWARKGIWGTVADRFGIRLFPVGYWVRPANGRGRRPTSPAPGTR